MDDPTPLPPNGTKPGFMTSEFWVTIAMVLTPIVMPFMNPETMYAAGGKFQLIGGIAAGVAAVAYTIGRILLKK